jgi:hypothetical protein
MATSPAGAPGTRYIPDSLLQQAIDFINAELQNGRVERARAWYKEVVDTMTSVNASTDLQAFRELLGQNEATHVGGKRRQSKRRRNRSRKQKR